MPSLGLQIWLLYILYFLLNRETMHFFMLLMGFQSYDACSH